MGNTVCSWAATSAPSVAPAEPVRPSASGPRRGPGFPGHLRRPGGRAGPGFQRRALRGRVLHSCQRRRSRPRGGAECDGWLGDELGSRPRLQCIGAAGQRLARLPGRQLHLRQQRSGVSPLRCLGPADDRRRHRLRPRPGQPGLHPDYRWHPRVPGWGFHERRKHDARPRRRVPDQRRLAGPLGPQLRPLRLPAEQRGIGRLRERHLHARQRRYGAPGLRGGGLHFGRGQRLPADRQRQHDERQRLRLHGLRRGGLQLSRPHRRCFRRHHRHPDLPVESAGVASSLPASGPLVRPLRRSAHSARISSLRVGRLRFTA